LREISVKGIVHSKGPFCHHKGRYFEKSLFLDIQ